MVVVALDLRPGHHVEDEVEGGYQAGQTAADLDTAVAGLRGAVREHLDVGPSLVSDLLDLLPALPDDAAHDGLVDEEPQVSLLAVVLLALLVHEGDGGLEDADGALYVSSLDGHDSLRAGTVRDPDLGTVV